MNTVTTVTVRGTRLVITRCPEGERRRLDWNADPCNYRLMQLYYQHLNGVRTTKTPEPPCHGRAKPTLQCPFVTPGDS